MTTGPKEPTPTFAAPAIGGQVAKGGVASVSPDVVTIALPSGLAYTFQYNEYGELLKVTYPSGGYTRYQYQASPLADYIWTTSYGGYADRRQVITKYVCRSSVTAVGATSSGYVGSVATNNCPVSEDVTTYSRTPTNYQVSSVTVTDPLLNQTVYQFGAYVIPIMYNPGNAPSLVNQGADNTLLETSHTIYQGSATPTQGSATPLMKIDTSYVDPSVNKGSDQPYSKTTTLYPSGLQSQVQWSRDFSVRSYSPTTYDRGIQTNGSYSIETGLPLEERDYDYGSGQPGPPLKTVDTLYLTTNAVNNTDYGSSNIYIIGKPTSVTVYNGTTKLAQTTYEYDNYSGSIAASNAIRHSSSFATSYTTRGNQTAVNRWRNTDNTFLTTRNIQLDDAGNVLIQQDPIGNLTTYDFTDSWGDSTCSPPSGITVTYPTKVTNAKGFFTKATYNSCTGTVASATDFNSQTASFGYDAMDRRVSASYPDGGLTCLQYSDTSLSGGACPSATLPQLPVTIVSSQKQSSSAYKTSTTILDGLSRVSENQLAEPGGASYTDYVDTSYDGLGHVASVSNPYRTSGSSTNPSTTFTYDALGQKTVQNQPDSTTMQWCYSNEASTLQTNCAAGVSSVSGQVTDYSDESGRHWQQVRDGLGRLTSMVEPNPSTNNLSLETDYSYDAMGDLVGVTQKGANGEQARSRSFTYDSLGRLVTASNPETGTITYQYVNGKALCAGDVTLPCVRIDARGLTTTYTYDAVNRLTLKTYSDGTLPAAFGYDGNDENGNAISGLTYPTMRLSRDSNEVITAADNYSYDKMGRLITRVVCVPSDCPGNLQVVAGYDLAGNQTSLTYPDGRVVTTTIDVAGRAQSIDYTKWNTTTTAQNYFSETNGYDAAGHLTSATFGNGVPFTAAYDVRERIGSLAYGSSTAPIWSKQLAWTTNGNLQSQTDLITGVQRQFNYDGMNRLMAAQDIYSNQAVPNGSNDNTGSASGSGSGAEETPGGTGAQAQWTDPDDSNLLDEVGSPNSRWSYSTVTTAINTAVNAPDGTQTARAVVGNNCTGSTCYLEDSPVQPSLYSLETMSGSVWMRTLPGVASQAITVYLMTNGLSVGMTQATLTSTWQQIQVTSLMPDNITSLTFRLGGIASGYGFLMWSPMLEDHGIQGTSVTNILPYSQLPSASSWQYQSASLTSGNQSAPDGSLTASTITAASGSSAASLYDAVANPSPVSSQPIAGSIYLQSSASLTVRVSIIETVGTTNTECGYATPTLSANWQRVTLTCASQNPASQLYLRVGGGGFVNGASFQIWGAQLELATSAGPYVATGASSVTQGTTLTNLLPYSQQPTASSWFPGSVTITPNVIAAPDGSMTASRVTSNAANGYLYDLTGNAALYDGSQLTGSVYLKSESGAQNVNIGVLYTTSAGTQSFAIQSVALSSVWQRFTVTGTAGAGMTNLRLQVGGSSTFASGETIDIWGAQLEIATHAGPYVATSSLPIIVGSNPSNILANSQNLSGANWGMASGSCSVNAATAPDGTNTAAICTAQNGSTDSYLRATVPNPSLYDGETVTGSVFLRATSGTQNVNLYIKNTGNGGAETVAQASPEPALTTTWQRFDVTGTLQNGSTFVGLQIGGGGSITNNQSFEVWGAQFVVGTMPAPYTSTNGNTTVYATGQSGTLVPTGLNQTYAYDSFGNILQNGSFNSSYTANNQMFGYAYDASGNLLSDGMNVMTWDAESRMSSGGGANYVYDANGDRVEKRGSSVTDTIYFGDKPIARLTDGQWTDLIYGPNGLLAEVPGTQTGAPVYRVTNHLGTNVGSLLANGTFVNPVDYMPFGQVFTGNTSDPYLFTGKERDAESGLDYFGARYYGSNMGRFMSPDWAAKAQPVPYAKLDNPQTLNLYAYVGNNPLSRIDKDGHYACQGDKAQCQAFKDALAIVQKADSALKEGSKERNQLDSVLKFYGKDDGKGPGIKFGDLGGMGAVGVTQTDHGKTTITFDTQALSGMSKVGQGETVAHEGTHGRDDHRPGVGAGLFWRFYDTEYHAYQSESYVDMGLGKASETDKYPSWVPGMSYADHVRNITRDAYDNSVLDCKNAGCTP